MPSDTPLTRAEIEAALDDVALCQGLKPYKRLRNTLERALRALLERAEDSERLDWLETHRRHNQVWECAEHNQSLTFSIGTYNASYRDGDIRATIDAARGEEPHAD